jgi:hypothetical protein
MPYKSDAQRRKFHAMLRRGEIPVQTVKEYDRASKGMHLPERVRRRKRKKGEKK